MNYQYPTTYQTVSLDEQKAILVKHFKIKQSLFPSRNATVETAEAPFYIPHWTLLGKTYRKALERVLDAIKSTRSFYNYYEGKLGEKYLRETDAKKEAFAPYKNKVIILPAQFGLKHHGESVEEVRKNYGTGEVGFGTYEVAIMLLTHPNRLQDYDDLCIDCPGDEYGYDGGGRFVNAPFLCFYGGGVRFVTKPFSFASDYYGSASGFLPQYPSALEPSILSIPSALPLSDRIAALEKFKVEVEAIFKLPQ